MKTIQFAAVTLAVALAIPSAASARKWYNEPGVWGGVGLVTGGAIGYALGRHDSRPAYYPPPPAPVYAQRPNYGYGGGGYGPSAQSGPIYTTGAYYVRDKRAFPFYRKTEIFPIASTMPMSSNPQSYSVSSSQVQAWDAPRAAAAAESAANVNIGNNNSNVTVNVGGSNAAGQARAVEYDTVTVRNNPRTLPPNRVVDLRVARQPVAQPAPQPEWTYTPEPPRQRESDRDF